MRSHASYEVQSGLDVGNVKPRDGAATATSFWSARWDVEVSIQTVKPKNYCPPNYVQRSQNGLLARGHRRQRRDAESLFQPEGDRRRPGVQPVLLIEPHQVGLHRPRRDTETACDLLVRQTQGDEPQDLRLPRGDVHPSL